MRPIISSIVLALALLAPVPGWTATWEADPAHTQVGFAIRHMMISTVRGTFKAFTASATGDPAKPADATIVATIQAASIDTANEKRDGHLKTADFLDVEK